MGHLSIRLPALTIERLDAVAEERGVTRSQVVRDAITAGLVGEPLPEIERPSEAELIGLLSERARAGNVAAIRSLLARIEERDPRARALRELELMAEARRQ
jgi:predicted transcriptional regulator